MQYSSIGELPGARAVFLQQPWFNKLMTKEAYVGRFRLIFTVSE